MKKTNKIIALALCMVLSIGCLAACGGSQSAPAAAAPAAAPAEEAAPVLKVATNVAFPPYEYYDNEQSLYEKHLGDYTGDATWTDLSAANSKVSGVTL